MRKCILGLAAATFAGVLSIPATSHAATSRIIYVHATGVCQPATPLELGGLRFRPLGVYNNKTESIYINCALDTEFVGDQDTTDIEIYFDNQGASQQTVTCTAVGGRRGLGSSAVAEATLLPAGTEDTVTFVDLNRVSESFSAFGISCLLPPKVEMGLIRLNQVDATDGL